MTLKQEKTLIIIPIIMLLAVLILFTFSLTCSNSEYIADAGTTTITFNVNNRTNSYGNFFWDSGTQVIADGYLKCRGDIDGSHAFSVNSSGSYYLVFQPRGIMAGGEMVRLTDDDGNITALPGVYELSTSFNYMFTYDFADIYEADGENLGVLAYERIQFTTGSGFPMYTINKRSVTVNVDDSVELLRYYGGPSVDIDYIIETGSMFGGDDLSVVFASNGNLQGAEVGEYDIEIDSYTIFNGGIDKKSYYNIIYSTVDRPLLNVEKYVIVALGLGDLTDFYRYDGDHSATLSANYEDITGINNETVRIYYKLDEANITRVNGALPVSLEGEGYPMIIDYDKVEVYNEAQELVAHKDNYEIDSTSINTRLIITKRDIELYSGEGVPDDDGLYINTEIISETYGYVFDAIFQRNIEIYEEDVLFEFSFASSSLMPEAGSHELILISADNPWYNITLNESFCFVIDKYVLTLINYIAGEGETKYVNIPYGVGLLSYSDTVEVEEAFEEVSFTLYSDVGVDAFPGEHDFTGYMESDNIIVDYSNVKIKVARKPIDVNINSPRPLGVEYGDNYSIILIDTVEDCEAQLFTTYCVGTEYVEANAIDGLPTNSGAYKIRCTLNQEALDFYIFEEKDYKDVSLNIAKRNIVVEYNLNYSTKEYNTTLSLDSLGELSNYYINDISEAGLINGDQFSGEITCAGLSKVASVGSYVINTSEIGNANYNIAGGIKVYYNEVETPSLEVTKLLPEHLPVFEVDIDSYNNTSIELTNISINGVEVGSFAISEDGGDTYSSYSSNERFSGLIPGKKYYFKVRIKGDSNILEGPESAAVSCATTISEPEVEDYIVTPDTISIQLEGYPSDDLDYSYQYRLNSGDWVNSPDFTDLESGTMYRIRYKCISEDNVESEIGSQNIWTQSAAPEIIIEDLPIEISSSTILLNGLENIYEFRIAEQSEDSVVEFSEWSSSTEFSNLSELTDYIIEVRVKASEANGNLSGVSSSFLLSTVEYVEVIEPIVYEGIMVYVGDYFIIALLAFMFILMLIFIIAFAGKFKIL